MALVNNTKERCKEIRDDNTPEETKRESFLAELEKENKLLGGVPRDECQVVKYYSLGGPNEKRDQGWAVACDDKFLCYGIKEYPFMIFYVLTWKTHADAEKWMKEGCIADIQESLQNLHVGFESRQCARLDDHLD